MVIKKRFGTYWWQSSFCLRENWFFRSPRLASTRPCSVLYKAALSFIFTEINFTCPYVILMVTEIKFLLNIIMSDVLKFTFDLQLGKYTNLLTLTQTKQVNIYIPHFHKYSALLKICPLSSIVKPLPFWSRISCKVLSRFTICFSVSCKMYAF